MTPIIEAIDLMEEREENKETVLKTESAFSVSVARGGNYCSDIC